MELKKELKKLKKYMDTNLEDAFKKQSDYIRTNFTSEEDKKIIDDFIAKSLSELSSETEELSHETESLLIRVQLKEICEMLSMSYIAKKYFNKDRTWIYQKINGNIKNGKPAKFTHSEMETFNFALQDISRKIGSITIHS